MRRQAVLIVGMLVVAVLSARAADPEKIPWETYRMPSGEVVIFGDIARPGFFALPEKGMTLRQLVVSAGMTPKAKGMVVLRRPVDKGEAKIANVELQFIVQD